MTPEKEYREAYTWVSTYFLLRLACITTDTLSVTRVLYLANKNIQNLDDRI